MLKPRFVASLFVAGLMAATPLFSVGQTVYTPPTTLDFTTIISPTVLAVAVAVLAGAALVQAFTVGGGFRVAKKAYNWIMGKV
jgi:hypothetical protein